MSLNGPYRCPSANQGSILILALWVIFMLAVLAVAVGAHIDGRLELARRMEQRLVGYYAARVGVERGLTRLLQETNGWDGLGEPWSDNPADFSNVVVGAGAYTLSYVPERSDGASNEVFGLWDEQSKIDLNLGRIELLVALLEGAGGLSREAAVRMGETILTARTKLADKSPAMGVASGWADSQMEPGPLRSIQELLWLKGMTPAVFKQVRDHVTVCGGNRVNVNTAGAVVLQCLGACGGGGEKAAQSLSKKILQFRERGGIFKSYLGSEMVESLGEGARLTDEERRSLYGMTPHITVMSDHFRGHAEGWMSGGSFGQRRRMDFVWNRKERKFEYWHED